MLTAASLLINETVNDLNLGSIKFNVTQCNLYSQLANSVCDVLVDWGLQHMKILDYTFFGPDKNTICLYWFCVVLFKVQVSARVLRFDTYM